MCGKIFELTPDGAGGYTRTEFARGLGSAGPIAMDFGPDRSGGRALYYTTFAGGGEVPAKVRRIAPVAN